MVVVGKYVRLSTEFEKALTLKSKINNSTRLNPDVVPPMASPEVALRASQEPSFGTGRTNTKDEILISARVVALKCKCQPLSEDLVAGEMALDYKSQPLSKEVVAAVYDKANIEREGHPTENPREENKEVIKPEVESALKNLVVNRMAKMVEGRLVEVLRKTSYNFYKASDLSFTTLLSR